MMKTDSWMRAETWVISRDTEKYNEVPNHKLKNTHMIAGTRMQAEVHERRHKSRYRHRDKNECVSETMLEGGSEGTRERTLASDCNTE